jgi:hypothetical protein
MSKFSSQRESKIESFSGFFNSDLCSGQLEIPIIDEQTLGGEKVRSPARFGKKGAKLDTVEKQSFSKLEKVRKKKSVKNL